MFSFNKEGDIEETTVEFFDEYTGEKIGELTGKTSDEYRYELPKTVKHLEVTCQDKEYMFVYYADTLFNRIKHSKFVTAIKKKFSKSKIKSDNYIEGVQGWSIKF